MKRRSVEIKEFAHVNPVPAACRIGNVLMSGVLDGRDPASGKMPSTLEEQCAHMFAHVRSLLAEAGGSADDIIKITVWMPDLTNRAALNVEWLKMFADPNSRPARHTRHAQLPAGVLIQCDVMAVFS